MKSPFKTVTKKALQGMKQCYYGSGRKLKVGDKTIGGFNVMYANLYAIPPSKINANEVSLALQLFVLDELSGMLYQLYNIK